MSIDPRYTRALLVGIESYKEGTEFNLDGPAHDACRLAAWLIERGVPPGNIRLVVKAIEPDKIEVPDGVVRDPLAGGEVDRACIDRAIESLEGLSEDQLLIVFWSGHGVVENDRNRHLLLGDFRDDYKKTVDLDSMCSYLCGEIFRFIHQIFIVDACASFYEDFDWKQQLAGKFPRPKSRHPELHILYASSLGQASANDPAEKTGIFFRALLPKLRESGDAWPPDMAAIGVSLMAVFQAERAAGRLEQVPEEFFAPSGYLPPPQPREPRIKISPRDLSTPDTQTLVGRGDEFDQLDAALADPEISIVKVTGSGGIGKTTLVWHWMEGRRQFGYMGFAQVFEWSFVKQGDDRKVPIDSNAFRSRLASHLADEISFCERRLVLETNQKTDEYEMGIALAEAFIRIGGLMVLDGLEVLQYHPTSAQRGNIGDPGMRGFIHRLRNEGETKPGEWRRLLVLTTRYDPPDVTGGGVEEIAMSPLSDSETFELFDAVRLRHFPTRRMRYGQRGEQSKQMAEPDRQSQARAINNACAGFPLCIVLVATQVLRRYEGQLEEWMRDRPVGQQVDQKSNQIIKDYFDYFEKGKQAEPVLEASLQLLLIFGLFDRPVDMEWIRVVRGKESVDGLTDRIINKAELDSAFDTLLDLGLLMRTTTNNGRERVEAWDAHPLLRAKAREVLLREKPEAWSEANRRLYSWLLGQAKGYPEDMDGLRPLYDAVAYGCKAGKHRSVFKDVFLNLIMRGVHTLYAVTRLGAMGPTLLALAYFFEDVEGDERWGRPIKPEHTDEPLDEQEQAILLILSGMIHTTLYGFAAAGARASYDALEKLEAANFDTNARFALLSGRWRVHHSLGQLNETQRINFELEELSELYRVQHPDDRRGFLIKLFSSVRNQSTTYFFLGKFDASLACAKRGLDMLSWFPSELAGLQAQIEVSDPAASCRYYASMSSWMMGLPDRALDSIKLARQRGRDQRHAQTEAIALYFQAWIHQFRGEYQEMLDVSDELCELSNRRELLLWIAGGDFMRGYARVARDRSFNSDSIRLMESGYKRWNEAEAKVATSYWQYLWADAHLKVATELTTPEGKPDQPARQSHYEDAIEWLNKGLIIAAESRVEWWKAEMTRARGEARMRLDPDKNDAQPDIEQAVAVAMMQNATALELRAVTSYLEYWLGRIENDPEARPKVLETRKRLGEIHGRFREGLRTADLRCAMSLILRADQELSQVN